MEFKEIFSSPPAPLPQGRGEQNSVSLQLLETHKEPKTNYLK